MSTKPLTPKQQRFVDEYLVDLNASAAARRAGYRGDANTVGPRLLANVGVQQAIAAGQQRLKSRVEVTQEMVIAELMKIAFGDQRRVMAWGPDGVKLRPSTELSADEAAVVAEVSETVTAAGGSLKVKTHDKVGALKLLGEHLGLFRQKVEVTGKDGKPLIPGALSELTDEQLAAIAAGGSAAAA